MHGLVNYNPIQNSNLGNSYIIPLVPELTFPCYLTAVATCLIPPPIPPSMTSILFLNLSFPPTVFPYSSTYASVPYPYLHYQQTTTRIVNHTTHKTEFNSNLSLLVGEEHIWRIRLAERTVLTESNIGLPLILPVVHGDWYAGAGCTGGRL